MLSIHSTPRTPALDGTSTGETITVRRILFDGPRRAGVREGDTLRLVLETDAHLLPELPDGRTVVARREWARFVEVRAAADAGVGCSASPAGGESEADGVLRTA